MSGRWVSSGRWEELGTRTHQLHDVALVPFGAAYPVLWPDRGPRAAGTAERRPTNSNSNYERRHHTSAINTISQSKATQKKSESRLLEYSIELSQNLPDVGETQSCISHAATSHGPCSSPFDIHPKPLLHAGGCSTELIVRSRVFAVQTRGVRDLELRSVRVGFWDFVIA